MTRLVEVAPGRYRIARKSSAPARSDLPLPYVISDIMEPTEQVDGRFYTSKSQFRAVGRAHGLIEIGNEKSNPKTRASDNRAVKEARRNSLRKAVARLKAGERAAPHKQE
jgi:hypothetical protein